MIASQYAGRVSLLRDKVDSFERYPFSLPALRSFEQLELHPKVTFFIGENGAGKSTLLEAMAVSLGFNAEGGSKNFRFGTRRSHSELHEYLRIAKGVRRPRPMPGSVNDRRALSRSVRMTRRSALPLLLRRARFASSHECRPGAGA